jgi:hypothetical protein
MATNPAFLETQSQALTGQMLELGLILNGNEITDSAFETNPNDAIVAEQTTIARPTATLPAGAYNAVSNAWELPAIAGFQFSNGSTAISLKQCFIVKAGTIVLLHTFATALALAPNQTVILKTPWSWQ